MSGYKRDIVMRIVPRNGTEAVYWFEDQLTDAGGHTRCAVRYPETMTVREDINRNLRPVVFGVRPEVDIECQIATMADQAFLSGIEDALLRPREYSVFLSLDGGVVEREVVLASGTMPDPLRGKTYVGARFQLSLRCKSLVQRKPVMMTDPGTGAELILNGGFEEWQSLIIAMGWSPANANIQIDQGTGANKQTGTYSAKVTKLTSAANYGAFVYTPTFNLNPGAWYRLKVSAKGGQTSVAPRGIGAQLWNSSYPASTGANPWALTFQAPTAGQSIGPGSGQWSFGGVVQQNVSTAGFTSVDVYFRGPTTPMNRSDVFNFRLHGIQDINEFIYYDDVSLYGPVLRPSYATW